MAGFANATKLGAYTGTVPHTTQASTASPKPGQPLDADTIARAQQGAAAIVAKLNQVCEISRSPATLVLEASV